MADRLTNPQLVTGTPKDAAFTAALTASIDRTLSWHAYTQTSEDGHIDLVDGGVYSPALAADVVEDLEKSGWTFTHGGTRAEPTDR